MINIFLIYAFQEGTLALETQFIDFQTQIVKVSCPDSPGSLATVQVEEGETFNSISNSDLDGNYSPTGDSPDTSDCDSSDTSTGLRRRYRDKTRYAVNC